jgi:hypothetical protein
MLELKPETGRKHGKGLPYIIELPAQKMAVVHTTGEPGRVMELVLPALYSSVYRLKSEHRKEGKADFKVGPLRARWPDAHLKPKEEWHGIWGLPIPADTMSLAQKVPEVAVEIETWSYGPIAEILHIGPYAEEGPTVQMLRDFIEQAGYDIAGTHEEEYLTGPTARVQRTIIRYPVWRNPVTTLGPVQEHSLLVVAGR